MKRIIPALLLISLAACGSKKSFSKDQMASECMKEMEKNPQAASLMNKDLMTKICNCSAEKMVAKYKSEADAKKDQEGAEAIGRECAMEAMTGK